MSTRQNRHARPVLNAGITPVSAWRHTVLNERPINLATSFTVRSDEGVNGNRGVQLVSAQAFAMNRSTSNKDTRQ